MAAFIFAAQMFNFQVIGGTSGHLLGGVLAAVLLGPWAATIVMACVVAVQALVFQDGGLVVLGANIFNMGVIGTLGGFAIYATIANLLGGESRGRLPAAAIAAWTSVVLGALAMAIELAISGTTPLELTLPAMVGVHMVIGIGEAVITVAALAFIAATRPDLFGLRPSSTTTGASRMKDAPRTLVVGRGPRDRGAGRDRPRAARLPGPGRPREGRRLTRGSSIAPAKRSTTCSRTTTSHSSRTRSSRRSLAGLVGIALVFGAMWLLGRVLARRRPDATDATDPAALTRRAGA